MKKILAFLMILAILCTMLCGCTQAEKISANLSKEADKLNITRKITVINVRNNEILYEIIAKCSLQNEGNNELVVISEVAEGQYKKDFIYLSDWITYVVQDVTGTYTDPYHYEINILPYLRGVGNFSLDFDED